MPSFDHLNSTPATASPPSATTLSSPFITEEHKVRWLFGKQNSRMAAGADRVSSSTLKHCTDQLAPVFTTIFSSLQASQVFQLFQGLHTIILVPKKPKMSLWTTDQGPSSQWWWRCWSSWSWSSSCPSPVTCSTLYSLLIMKTDPWMVQSHWPCSSSSSILTLPTHIFFLDFSSTFNTILIHRNSLKNFSIVCPSVIGFCTF